MSPAPCVLLRSLIVLLLAVGIAPVVSAVGWFDDFNDGNAEDGNPVTWTYNEIGFTPGIHDASSGDYILSNPGGGTDDSMLPTVNVNFTDVFVRTQAVVLPGMEPGQVSGTLGVVARWSPTTVSGYAAILSTGAHLQLLRADLGAPFNLMEVRNLPVDTASDAMIELNVVGDLLSVYVWRPEEPKPTEPIATANDPIYISGRAGLLHNENHDGVQGVFRFAAAQDMPFIEPLAGDFNNDGSVDAADYVVWRKGLGTAFTEAHYEIWRTNFGGPPAPGAAAGLSSSVIASVPEPTSLVLLMLAVVLSASACRRC